jgi:hypothetical protein
MDEVNELNRMYPQPDEVPYVMDGMDGQAKRNMLVNMLQQIPLN